MWIGSVYETKNDLVSIVSSQKPKTKFPININNVPIYFATDSYDARRFTYAGKYERIIKWCEYFTVD